MILIIIVIMIAIVINVIDKTNDRYVKNVYFILKLASEENTMKRNLLIYSYGVIT